MKPNMNDPEFECARDEGEALHPVALMCFAAAFIIVVAVSAFVELFNIEGIKHKLRK